VAEPRTDLLDFLDRCGATTSKHGSGTLLEHLVGTFRILDTWDQKTTVCEAGLLHAVYGTRYFSQGLVSDQDRNVIRDLIGASGERLVFAFSRLGRQEFFGAIVARSSSGDRWDPASLWLDAPMADLAVLLAANLLEPSNARGNRNDCGLASYRALIPVVPPAVQDALASYLIELG
jgi:hypothetical protein